MDSILFYGEQDEATRRQVRSAAAQHSHRIGPRKPKASKLPRADSGTSKRRNLQKATAIAVAPIARGSAGKLTPTTLIPSPTNTTTNVQPDQSVDANNEASMRDQKELRRPSSNAHWEWRGQQYPQIHASAFHSNLQQSSSQPPALSLRVPAPPPLSIERIDRPQEEARRSSDTRSNSQVSPQSPSMRLPQYSWTEYPRYGLGHRSSLQMLAQVATDRETTDQPAPPFAPCGAPESRNQPANP